MCWPHRQLQNCSTLWALGITTCGFVTQCTQHTHIDTHTHTYLLTQAHNTTHTSHISPHTHHTKCTTPSHKAPHTYHTHTHTLLFVRRHGSCKHIQMLWVYSCTCTRTHGVVLYSCNLTLQWSSVLAQTPSPPRDRTSPSTRSILRMSS